MSGLRLLPAVAVRAGLIGLLMVVVAADRLPAPEPVIHPPLQSWAPDPVVGKVRRDVVVYGATASGVMAAIAAARQGSSVALVEPTAQIGGMVTSGISLTDVGVRTAIGGLALEFYRRVALYYELNRYGVSFAWYPEPHVALAVLSEMLSESSVDLYLGQRLRLPDGVQMDGTTVTSILMESGAEFAGTVFIDSSYEGDLMAAAGAPYVIGRESAAAYGESLAGVRPGSRVYPSVPARYTSGDERLLPDVREEPGGLGTADERIQPYNFRLCFSSDPINQVAFGKPAGYRPGRYLLVQRILDHLEVRGKSPALSDILVLARIPNGKVDVNSASIIGTDLIGGSWAYPDADYDARARIWSEHFGFDAGLLYYLSHDESVPRRIRDELNRWGLCRDEWTASGNWPPLLYVREGRRLVNDAVLTQQDLTEDPQKDDSIGLGSYRVDGHTVSLYAGADGQLFSEGGISLVVPSPYEIPYSILVPPTRATANLLVSLCVAASHVAYASLRMEPQYMIMGEAAGVAAGLAVESDVHVADVPVFQIQRLLRAQGARLESAD